MKKIKGALIMNNSFTTLLCIIYPFLVGIFEAVKGKNSKEQVEALAGIVRDKLKGFDTTTGDSKALHGLIYDALDDYYILLDSTRGQANTERERARKQEQRKRKEYFNYFINIYILLNTLNDRYIGITDSCMIKAVYNLDKIKFTLAPFNDESVNYEKRAALYIEQVEKELYLLRIFILYHILDEDRGEMTRLRMKLWDSNRITREAEHLADEYKGFTLAVKDEDSLELARYRARYNEQKARVKRLKGEYINEVEKQLQEITGKFENIILSEQGINRVVEGFNDLLDTIDVEDALIDDDVVYKTINYILKW